MFGHSSQHSEDAAELKAGLESAVTWLIEAGGNPADVEKVRADAEAAFSAIVRINDVCSGYAKNHPDYDGELD